MATSKPTGVMARCIAEDVQKALDEDVGSGDLTAELIPADHEALATVISRDDAIICGRPWFDEVFQRLSSQVMTEWLINDGNKVTAGGIVCRLRGPIRPLLTGERAALNFLQLLSATATLARAYVDAVAGTRARILDTRKTLPGLRLAQKYAVSTGGAGNHRVGLFDGVLIKENHIVAAGGIKNAAEAARNLDAKVLIEIEVENLAELEQGLEWGADRLLLDNFSNSDLLAAVATRDKRAPDIGLEASGGISLETVRAVAETGVDFISVGALTKDIRAVDLSMRLELA